MVVIPKKPAYLFHRKQMEYLDLRTVITRNLIIALEAKPVRPFVDILYLERKIDDRIFSLCLGKNGGYITFGGANESLNLNNSYQITFPMDIDRNYEIPLKRISVNSQSISMEGIRTIIDSGATYTQLPGNVETQIGNIIESTSVRDKCKLRDPYCYRINRDMKSTKEFFQTFPVINFLIGNSVIAWHPSEYLVVSMVDSNCYCLGVEHQV